MNLRVRQVLDQIGGNSRKGLIKYLPEYSLPEDTKGIFPNAILSSYSNSENKYSKVGILTETLVLMPVKAGKYTLLSNLTHIKNSPEIKEKILKSKTTSDYLLKIEKTQNILNQYLETHNLSLEDALFDQELLGKNISGHPDAVIGKKIVIEVKTTSRLDKDHAYFIQQLSAYMSLNPSFTHGILVLPLQSTIIVLNNWPAREKYLSILENKAEKYYKILPNN
jgi:CRISPR/Cas system-associated exonuclease Cas4 (RecB family)